MSETDALETAKEMFAAIAYVHDRLGQVVKGKPVRDLDEALAAYDTTAKSHTRALAASLSREAALREALELAQKRIAFYGAISSPRHYDHDITAIHPVIDAALKSPAA